MNTEKMPKMTALSPDPEPTRKIKPGLEFFTVNLLVLVLLMVRILPVMSIKSYAKRDRIL